MKREETVLKAYDREERNRLSNKLLKEGYSFVDWNYEYDLYENKQGHRVRVDIIR